MLEPETGVITRRLNKRLDPSPAGRARPVISSTAHRLHIGRPDPRGRAGRTCRQALGRIPVFQRFDRAVDEWLYSVTRGDPGVSSDLAHLSRLCNNIILAGAAVLRLMSVDGAEIDRTYQIWKPMIMSLGFGRGIAPRIP